MKRLLPAALLPTLLFTTACDERRENPTAESTKEATGKVEASTNAAPVAELVTTGIFSWRKVAGDFPKDKPGYLILTTEDAVRWSKVLPEFVKQKESMGFRVYLATEKDYGTGKKGNAQAAQV